MFYQVGGLVGFQAGSCQKYGFKGVARRKIWGVNRGPPNEILLSFAVTVSSLIMKIKFLSYQNAKIQLF